MAYGRWSQPFEGLAGVIQKFADYACIRSPLVSAELMNCSDPVFFFLRLNRAWNV